mmetsp:Transcript_3953/g.5704  ORF Transcript_3953/g.5704 Transcript_3953/m.5704 type:complete len:225 (+) Transcript_3953:212-886(+)|eukprot:CAMPEP_0194218428 /NCGR_PEP_ID=MMETSP0156-20130528/23736_1 /TAXON_ID=33649 /ORGANISM="Thalassionema nitzschioides, Strain L26-B" /LENGTH=224 /DNA_ID=CAMNT_0038947775 /DNA_START=139 /DNA_END=813 /DNA_ORIENTATION=-
MAIISNVRSNTGILSTDVQQIVSENSMRDGLDLRNLYNDELPKCNLLNRQKSNYALEVNSRRRQIREELDLRNMAMLKDNDDHFRKIQSELRKSGVSTGMASLQMLDQQLTAVLIEKRSQEFSLDDSKDEESIEQRVTKTMIQNRMNLMAPIPTPKESKASRVMRRLSLTSSIPNHDSSATHQQEANSRRAMRRLSLSPTTYTPQEKVETEQPRPRRRRNSIFG